MMRQGAAAAVVCVLLFVVLAGTEASPLSRARKSGFKKSAHTRMAFEEDGKSAPEDFVAGNLDLVDEVSDLFGEDGLRADQKQYLGKLVVPDDDINSAGPASEEEALETWDSAPKRPMDAYAMDDELLNTAMGVAANKDGGGRPEIVDISEPVDTPDDAPAAAPMTDDAPEIADVEAVLDVPDSQLKESLETAAAEAAAAVDLDNDPAPQQPDDGGLDDAAPEALAADVLDDELLSGAGSYADDAAVDAADLVDGVEQELGPSEEELDAMEGRPNPELVRAQTLARMQQETGDVGAPHGARTRSHSGGRPSSLSPFGYGSWPMYGMYGAMNPWWGLGGGGYMHPMVHGLGMFNPMMMMMMLPMGHPFFL